MIKLLVLNFLNSNVSEEDIIESIDIKAIKTIIDEVILNNAEFLIILFSDLILFLFLCFLDFFNILDSIKDKF